MVVVKGPALIFEEEGRWWSRDEAGQEVDLYEQEQECLSTYVMNTTKRKVK